MNYLILRMEYLCNSPETIAVIEVLRNLYMYMYICDLLRYKNTNDFDFDLLWLKLEDLHMKTII